MNHIEIIRPAFKHYVLDNAELEIIGQGFRWLEGPVWMGDWDCLLFQDLPRDRTMRWSEAEGLTVFRQPSHYGNGQARDRQGRLLTCSHQDRCIYRTEHDGGVVAVATHHDGKRLNAPNDIVVKSDDSVWFTDPLYGLLNDYEGGRQSSEQPPAVYRLDADGTLTKVAGDFDGPNGIAFSPDERRLYIAETGDQSQPDPKQYIRVFDVDGASLGGGDIFHKIKPGYCDGMKVDEHGNVWSSAADGVHCLSPDGELLGKIKIPFRVSNLCFGGGIHRNRLFIQGSHTLFALFVNVRGATWPDVAR